MSSESLQDEDKFVSAHVGLSGDEDSLGSSKVVKCVEHGADFVCMNACSEYNVPDTLVKLLREQNYSFICLSIHLLIHRILLIECMYYAEQLRPVHVLPHVRSFQMHERPFPWNRLLAQVSSKQLFFGCCEKQWSFFFFFFNLLLDTLIQKNYFLIIDINNFRCDLSDVSAKTATLVSTGGTNQQSSRCGQCTTSSGAKPKPVSE